MKILRLLKIGPRLCVALGGVLLLTVMVGSFSLNRLGTVNENTKELATNWLPATRALGAYQVAQSTMRRSLASTVINGTEDFKVTQSKRIAALKESAAGAWRDYSATVATFSERKLAEAIQVAQDRAYRAIDQSFAINYNEADAHARAVAAYSGETKASFEALLAAIEQDVDFQTKGGNAAYEEAKHTYDVARWGVFGLLGAAITIGSALAFAIGRSIVRPLERAVLIAETVAAGDLTSNVSSVDIDETGQLLRALGRMNDGLLEIVSNVRNSSDSIATGSSQIAIGNIDLSQRTEEQASSLQQTAAAMEQLTATVNQNSENARAAKQIASCAAAAAENGGRVVGLVVATMGQIARSSRKIVDIIGVIDGIAFQTNILALNAAVEAARAGEQGRGFAVVASEVRSLAQRSAEAAKEIKSLIGVSVANVSSGTMLVDEAGQSMASIVMEVSRVCDLIGEISAASVEQSSGIGQIGKAVQQLDEVTQQNAALVEESAAAAESLRAQSTHLADTVAVFRMAAN